MVKRRYMQYSLRSLLILLTVASVLCSLGRVVYEAREKASRATCENNLRHGSGPHSSNCPGCPVCSGKGWPPDWFQNEKEKESERDNSGSPGHDPDR